MPGTDAVWNEAIVLRRQFGGQMLNLYPLSGPSRWFPKPLYGLHCRTALRRLDGQAGRFQVYFPTLYPFPVLSGLRQPLIYTVTAGLHGQRPPRGGALERLAAVVVSNERDLNVLRAWGAPVLRLIRPGIELERFERRPIPPRKTFVLLAGSAPWIRAQFRQKGVDALLHAARRQPRLRLVFLWRGLLLDELRARIRRYGVERQVAVLAERADVNAQLGLAHAAVVLAETAKIVKAYPRSLLEALAAGRPAMISRSIPMADYVAERGCGVVLPDVSADAVLAAVERMEAEHARLCENAAVCAADFSMKTFLQAYEALYAEVGTGPQNA